MHPAFKPQARTSNTKSVNDLHVLNLFKINFAHWASSVKDLIQMESNSNWLI